MANSPYRIAGSEQQSGAFRPPVQQQAPGNLQAPAERSQAEITQHAIRLAQQAGDMEAVQELQQVLAQDYQAETAGAATEGQGPLGNFAAGVGRGVTNVGRHVANVGNEIGQFSSRLVGADPRMAPGMTDEALQSANELDAPLLADGAGAAGNFVGETAALAPAGVPFSGSLARMGAPVARQMAKPVVRGAVEGAGQGALMADPGSGSEGLVAGALAGTVLPGAMAGTGKLARGATRTPEAQHLMDRGVELTPGQMNPRGFINQIEETTTSLPGQGAWVSEARNNARRSYNQAAAREAAAPGATIKTQDDPRAMLDDAYNSFEPLYDQAKGFPIVTAGGKPVIVNNGANVPLAQELTRILSAKGVTNKVRNKAKTFLENEFSRDLKTSDDLLKMRSSIRTRIRNANSSVGDSNEIGDEIGLLEQAEKAITQVLDSQLPPGPLQTLRAADQKYAQFKVYEAAMRKAGDKADGFTPSQLAMVVRDNADPGSYARGKAGGEPREFARAGVETLEQRAPVTGARMLTLPNVPIVRDAMAAPFSLMAGTKTGRRLAAGMTKPQRAAVAMAQQIAPHVNPDQRRRLARAMSAAIVTGATQNTRAGE